MSGRFDALLNPPKPPEEVKPLVSPAMTQQEENFFASKPVNHQGSKPSRKQTSLPVNPQTSKDVSRQITLPANQQGSKLLKKFSSYLTEESLKKLKRIAFETDRKDYEVLQEAVDQYLKQVTGTK